jgi:Zn-dependent M28 family amino/carboxypeptidase
MDDDNLILVGREPTEQLRDAPIIFVGHGAVLGEKNIDQLSGADLKGAVVLMLYSAPKQSGFPAFSERAKAAVAAGASAVIAIFGNDVPWSAVQASYREAPDRLQSEPVASIQGGLPSAAAASLVNQSGSDFEQLVSSAADAGFRAVPLNARATFDVSTFVRRYNSHNVIGRLRGTGNTGESVLYLGHWDHLGICRPEGAKDRICNGAVDNASGIAMMIEAARHLARAPRPERDILFLATTAEEMGLLGAEYFGANPVVPLKSIVAAVNMDTVAITPKGEPVATIGRGTTPMDPLIEATARELGRRVDTDTEANVMIQRQDGWALARAGVPTVMVGGGFSDMKKLQAYLAGPYHKPEDDLDASIDLSGAVEDTDLLIALGRKLANPKQYRPAAR